MRASAGSIVLAAGLLLGGCDNTVNPQPVEASGSTLCVVDYEVCVNPIFDAALNGRTGVATCSSGGCHSQASGSGGAFKIHPGATTGSAEMMANYFSARSFANLDDPPGSRLLQKPTAGRSAAIGGHAGGDIFPGTTDECHAVIQNWIATRVDDANASVCGSCVPVDVSTCGY
ncbi:hypothetical protein DFR24_1403 [Panacagrimonas perspica]|uniref:Uncharacterized protein n=2 Tax=Panacagrimonas perspica TaxID=381431 RepID=A0A4R7PCZ1_9GAMM|nr:hypothetical protein [Panacagrimonas perspica]TDU32015.1 hypothetical protein DFR24_1403 [Panacagrimonas perspica]